MNICSKCGMAVIIFQGNVYKACPCDAPIYADMKAAAYGKGGAKI